MAQRDLFAALGLLLAACGGIAVTGDAQTGEEGGSGIVDGGVGGNKGTGGYKSTGGYRSTGGSASTGGWVSAGAAGMGGAVALCGAGLCGVGQACCYCARGPTCSSYDCMTACEGVDVAPPPPTCNRNAMSISGCVQRVGGDDAGPFTDIDRTIHGTVQSVMAYVPGGGCLASFLPNGEGHPDEGSPIALFVVDGSGVTWDVEYFMPSAFSPFFSGEAIDINYHYRFGGFSPSVRRLSASSGLYERVYVVQGGGIGDAVGAPVKLSASTIECVAYETCGSWQKQQIIASSENTSVVIPSGVTSFVGPYRVTNGGLLSTTSYSSTCADWSVEDFSVAVIALPPAAGE